MEINPTNGTLIYRQSHLISGIPFFFSNSLVFENINCGTKHETKDKYGYVFCPTAIRYLHSLIDKHNTKIIISSSWRYSGIKWLKALWKFRNLPGEIIDTTCCQSNEDFKKQFEEIQKLTKIRFSSHVDRGYEIQAYLNLHPEIENYVIFASKKVVNI